LLLLPSWWSLNALSFCATMKRGRNSLPSTIVGLWNCNNHYYTWCPPTSFPLFRTLPPRPSILQIKAHSFSGRTVKCPPSYHWELSTISNGSGGAANGGTSEGTHLSVKGSYSLYIFMKHLRWKSIYW
jgi:hypothetical protein